MTSNPEPQPSYSAQPQGGSIPLGMPYYGASLPTAFSRFWKKYATFSGRASRSEYWWVQLVLAVVYTALGIAALVAGSNGSTVVGGQSVPGPGFFPFAIIMTLVGLAVIVPQLAVTWRRLHDGNFGGGFFFLSLIPSIGSLIVTVLTILPSKSVGARFDRAAS